MSNIKSLTHILPLAIILLGLVSYNFMSAQWTPAPANPPSNNTEAPVNVSANYQVKAGDFGAIRMRAGEYCDPTGTICTDVTGLDGSSSGPTGMLQPAAWGVVRGDGIVRHGYGVESVVPSGTAWVVTLSSPPTGDTNYIVTPEVSSNDQAAVTITSPTTFNVQARTSNFNPFLTSYFSFIVWSSPDVVPNSWNVGAWGSCVVPGGGYGAGTNTRTVQCVNQSGTAVDDDECAAEGAKPTATKNCTLVKYVPPVKQNSCFIAGTDVIMADGSSKDIEDVVMGEQVKGSDGRVNTVLGYDRPMLGTRLLYSFNDGTYFVTAEHPFLTTDGWKAIDVNAFIAENASLVDELKVTTLQVGDSIVMDDGSVTKINSIKSKVAPDQRLYNLKLDGDNTYFVDGYTTHNKKD